MNYNNIVTKSVYSMAYNMVLPSCPSKSRVQSSLLHHIIMSSYDINRICKCHSPFFLSCSKMTDIKEAVDSLAVEEAFRDLPYTEVTVKHVQEWMQ